MRFLLALLRIDWAGSWTYDLYAEGWTLDHTNGGSHG